MVEKSHVGMGHSLCPVCGAKHNEVVLLDKHLRKTLTRDMITGWELCPEHQQLYADGYVALVECTNESSPTLMTADRTGMLAHIRRSVWTKIFDSRPPEGPLAFVQEGVISKLQEKQQNAHA